VTASLPSVPCHLRGWVVEQDYAQYNEVDHAIWRFVLLQTHSRLVETAHPAYRDGLAATGISVERIPSITEMNDKLSRFGWGAVCVDGFIPPRAFQELQGCGILPIAADIRTREHLVYTPAPDIIHEAAGHAPILPDPAYSSYLRRIGELGRQAFTVPEDDRVFRAIYRLSEVKEDPSKSTEEVCQAETELEAALAAVPSPSEATRLSRLYWWTAEYGLVGRVDDYKIYGAGLLSSLGESHSCDEPSVLKLALDEHSADVAYDVTRPQPQLFVVPSFDVLHDTLERVARTLAIRVGGEVALTRALRSGELATYRFSSGACLIGVLRDVGPNLADAGWMTFDGRVALAWNGLTDLEREHSGRCIVLTGKLADGSDLGRASDGALAQLRDRTTGRHRFVFSSGARLEGRLEQCIRQPDGRLIRLELSGVRSQLPGAPAHEVPHYALIPLGDFVTAHAGAVDPKYHAETTFSSVRVPRERRLPPREQALLSLYESARAAHLAGLREMEAEFSRIEAVLARDDPDEWLLRWNMLESLLKARSKAPQVSGLRAELERLEVRFDRKQPIASGLRYLWERVG
jgi:phenylalanine-4-hydroxylase